MTNNFIDGLEIEIRREEWEYKDLMNDFEFVKELNKELSLRYQDFVDSLPLPEEVDVILKDIDTKIAILINNEDNYSKETKDNIKSDIEDLKKRLFQLRRFRTAAVILEKDRVDNKPVKYEEMFGDVD